MIADGMGQATAPRSYASGGEFWSLKELWNYKLLKRNDPEAARVLKTEKTSQAKAWHEANHSPKAKALSTERKTATDEQIIEAEYLTALVCGGMDDFGERVLIHGKLDMFSEAAGLYGQAWEKSQDPNAAAADYPASNAKATGENVTANPQPRRYGLLTVADLSAMPHSRYRVKNVLPREGIAAIFGPPGVAKSFLALDLAFTLSDGGEWCGYRVEQCDVLYLCLEGQGGLAQRVQAYREHHGQDTGTRIRFITAPFSLLYQDDVDALVDTVKEAGIRGGVIMVDTLSAGSPGADENSSVDMGRILQAIKRLCEECGVLVILVHHSGKDATRGLRGHSSLPAASDAVIEVRREDDRRTWRLIKSKDGIDGKEHAFRLSSVELGTDDDGDSITSCIIKPEERATDSVRRVKLPKGGNQKVVYDVAGELLRASKDSGKGGAPYGRPCISVDELIEACRGRLAVENDRVPERVRIAVTGLVNAGCLILREGWIHVP